MKIRLNGDRWNMELRKSHITDSDKKCPIQEEGENKHEARRT